jgi:hypothetical protein
MPTDFPRDGKLRNEPRSGKPAGISAIGAPANYQSALLKIIEYAENDPRQLRWNVYELARMNLRREIRQRRPPLTAFEEKECMLALETAIARVEADSSRAELADMRFPPLEAVPLRLAADHSLGELSDLRPSVFDGRHCEPEQSGSGGHQGEDQVQPSSSVLVPILPRERFGQRTEHRDRFALSIEPIASLRADPAIAARTNPAIAQADKPQIEIVYPEREKPDAARLRRRVWLWFIGWPLIQLAGPVIFCVVLYMALAGRFDLETARSPQTTQPYSGEEAVRKPSGLPLPSSFGVYAISNGSLNELEALPIKAPDARVALSAEIKQPSRTILPDGHVVFVVFRRDLLNSAPQKVAVRVIARVARAMTFNSGKVVNIDLDGSWRIRNNSYEFRVSPLNENREMVAIRPEAEEFALPAGRYALVFGGLAYDFTVDGPITATAQCLESFDSVTAPVFSECRPK